MFFNRLTSRLQTVLYQAAPTVSSSFRTNFISASKSLSIANIASQQISTVGQHHVNFTPAFDRKFTSLSLDTLKKPIDKLQFGIRIGEKLQSLAVQSNQALASYSKQKPLPKGLWYPADLYNLLKKNEDEKRIKFFTKTGAFYSGYANSKLFKLVKEFDISMPNRCSFTPKKGIAPASALKEIANDFVIGDCLMAYTIAFYQTLLETIGEEKFNLLFNDHFKMIIGGSETFLSSHCFLSEITECSTTPSEMGNRPIKKGQHVYFPGVENYSEKHLFEHWNGIHTICIDDTPGKQLFVGLGLDPNGETEKQICEKLLIGYNENANLEMGLSKKQLYALELRFPYFAIEGNFQAELKDVKGFEDARLSTINEQMLESIVKADIKEISPNFFTKKIIRLERQDWAFATL